MYSYTGVPPGRPNARGSSLIEIMMLFSLVGMVSAFAIPRYTRLANQARATQVAALNGSLLNVARSAHEQFLASSSKLDAATLEGKAVTLKYGYPDTSVHGIRAVMTDSGGFTTKVVSSTSVVFMKKGAVDAAQCAVTYTVAEPQVSAETVTKLALDGC